MSYRDFDYGLIAFGYKEEDRRNKEAVPKPKRKPGERDKRYDHRHSEKDSEYVCPLHNTPLKRYEANKGRFAGYGTNGERLVKSNVYYRCNHCLWLKLPSYYPEKYFTE